MAYNLSSDEVRRIQKATPEQYAQAWSLIQRGKTGAVRGDKVLQPLVNAMLSLGVKSAEQLRRERSEWEFQEGLPPKKLDLKTGKVYYETPAYSGGVSQIAEQVQVSKQQQVKTPVYQIVPYSSGMSRKENLKRISTNILKRQIQRRKAEFEGLKKGYDFVTGGNLTEKGIRKSQIALNKQVEEYNENYTKLVQVGEKNGVKTYKQKELTPEEYGQSQKEYLNLLKKQQEIDNRKANLKTSFKGKIGRYVYGKWIGERNERDINRDIERETKNLQRTLKTLDKVSQRKGIISKARVKVLNKIIASELQEINDIKNLVPKKFAIGYVPILPAGLGTPTGLKGIKYGLRDLYGIRLKGTKQLTSEVKSYYLKPSKAKLTKIKATQKRLKLYDAKLKKLGKSIRTIKRKDLKYLGKTMNIKIYSLKKAPLSTRIKGKIKGFSLKKLKPKIPKIKKVSRKNVEYIGRIGKAKIYKAKPRKFIKGKILTYKYKRKIPSKKTQYRYIARIGKARIYKTIKTKPSLKISDKNKFGLIGKSVKGKQYKYIGRTGKIKFYQVKKAPIKTGSKQRLKLLQKRAKDFREKYVYVGDSNGIKVYKLKKVGSITKAKKYIRGLTTKKKTLSVSQARELIRKGKVREVTLDIKIPKTEIRRLVNRTIRNMSQKKQRIFFNYVKQANRELTRIKTKNNVRQLQAQLNRFKSKYVTGQGLISKSKLISVPTYRNMLYQLAVLTQLFKLKAISREKFNQARKSVYRSGQGQGQGEGQGQGQGQGLAVSLATAQAQIIGSPQITPQKYIQTPGGVPGKRRFVPYISLKLRRGKTNKRGENLTGYVVYGKYNNRFLRLNKLPLTKQDALSRGSYAIDRTTSKTFKLVPVTGVKKFGLLQKRERGYYTKSGYKFREYVINRGKRYNVLLKKVEKRRYGIDTPGEKRGLSLARYLRKLKRGKY